MALLAMMALMGVQPTGALVGDGATDALDDVQDEVNGLLVQPQDRHCEENPTDPECIVGDPWCNPLPPPNLPPCDQINPPPPVCDGGWGDVSCLLPEDTVHPCRDNGGDCRVDVPPLIGIVDIPEPEDPGNPEPPVQVDPSVLAVVCAAISGSDWVASYSMDWSVSDEAVQSGDKEVEFFLVAEATYLEAGVPPFFSEMNASVVYSTAGGEFVDSGSLSLEVPLRGVHSNVEVVAGARFWNGSLDGDGNPVWVEDQRMSSMDAKSDCGPSVPCEDGACFGSEPCDECPGRLEVPSIAHVCEYTDNPVDFRADVEQWGDVQVATMRSGAEGPCNSRDVCDALAQLIRTDDVAIKGAGCGMPCTDFLECYEITAYAYWQWDCTSTDLNDGQGDPWWRTRFEGLSITGFGHSHEAVVDWNQQRIAQATSGGGATIGHGGGTFSEGTHWGDRSWYYSWVGWTGSNTEHGHLRAQIYARGTSTELTTYGQTDADYSDAGAVNAFCTTGDNPSQLPGPNSGTPPPSS